MVKDGNYKYSSYYVSAGPIFDTSNFQLSNVGEKFLIA